MPAKHAVQDGLAAIARSAVDQFSELTGLAPETVSGAKKDGDGWSFLVDVVELERIPATITVLASYRVDVDRQGALVGYERLRRFTRGTID